MRVSARRVVGGAVLSGGAVLLRPGTPANRFVCGRIGDASKRLRHLSGQLQGLQYRLGGGRPDPGVIDNVLADRIRSELGAMEKGMDIPHVHVMVENHVVLLHGEVDSEDHARKIERAVAHMSGVAGVDSFLHVGLGRGDTRPSEGRAVHQPSEGLERLLGAATGAGVDPDSALPVTRAVLATFAERLPEHERELVAGHLSHDVLPLFTPPARTHHVAGRERSVHDLVSAIATATGELPPDKAEQVTASVLHTLRDLVPEEARSVGAVLPKELRVLWQRDGER